MTCFHVKSALAIGFALALGSACTNPDEVATTKPDGGFVDPGDGGPGVVDLTCPPLSMPVAAGTVFVDAAVAGGNGSQRAPFESVAQAFASAGPNGVIYVAAGTYKQSLDIPDKNLTLYGGFASGFGSRTDACATILEPTDASQTVLEASSNVQSFGLDGVTVQHGSRGLTVEGDPMVGAMYTIASSVFADNGKPDAVGGGAYLDRVSAKISRTAFRGNRAEKGAAIAHGGDDATIVIEESVFDHNIGYSDHGGALYLSPKTGTIIRNTFRGNEIGKTAGYGWGGAVIIYKAGAAPVTTDFAYNVFTDNLASVGGAVFIDDGATATMSHDLLYRNRSIAENGVARGAALYVDGLGGPGQGSRLVADHLTVANNNLGEDGAVSLARGGGVYLETYSTATFTSSIFWNNGDEALFGDPTCSISVSYAIAPSSCSGVSTCTIGSGVFQPAAVEFVDEAANDYHEKSTAGHFSNGTWVIDNVSSPAIDKAEPAATVAAEPTPNGNRANLGVYGQTAEASKSPLTSQTTPTLTNNDSWSPSSWRCRIGDRRNVPLVR